MHEGSTLEPKDSNAINYFTADHFCRNVLPFQAVGRISHLPPPSPATRTEDGPSYLPLAPTVAWCWAVGYRLFHYTDCSNHPTVLASVQYLGWNLIFFCLGSSIYLLSPSPCPSTLSLANTQFHPSLCPDSLQAEQWGVWSQRK